ncbi:tetratricopeptide repeat domain-containing protein [Trichoderma breve]|uniref:Tetratricopeptide repeat domain-containing protein n=1 Tax=Trichoderma breve TaxID=2034170 RepID=A0A9W9B885_9HYPO|nr:tetratricopeptide repeat domain-containing protein [Trichoderma breve]KAJ4858432.1 tetratricopeptide repeat domain-containing protein [Trichoderma breve]
MAPSPTAVGSLLGQVVHYHLDNGSYDNALFFAERYAAQDSRSSEAAYLLSLCHLRLGDHRSAYDVSKPAGYRGVNLGCIWVFAQACLALERFKDGITALDKAKSLWSQKSTMGKHSATTRSAYPDAPAVLCLLGKLYRGYDDKKRAVSSFEEALKLNAFQWDAFKALCDMGVKIRVPNIFKASDSLLQNLGQDLTTLPAPKKSSMRSMASDTTADPFGVSFSAGDMTPMSENMLEPPHAPTRRTRNVQHMDQTLEAPPRMNYRMGSKRNAAPREKSNSQEQPMEPISDAPSAPTGNSRSSVISTTDRKRTLAGHPVSRSTNNEEHATRRSARLIKPSANKTNLATPAPTGPPAGRELKKARPPVSRIVRPGSSGSNNVGKVISGNRNRLEDHTGDGEYGEMGKAQEAPPHPVPKIAEPDTARLEEALRWVMDLMKKLGSGYYFLSQFQCQEAVQALSALPAVHQSSPWVLALMGRAHYEQASYAEAEKYFRRMRAQAPSRLEDMEVYSTILWHLKRETELSFLAHELVDASWHSPQAWCALGNAWSLARDPEQALKCFKRATQLDPKFAYGFTLQGHEHVTNEEYDKALTTYRQAISADKRHYNAYYGIGRVQQRLGAYDKALTHFQAAHLINPNNAVLVTCIGTALEKQKQILPALRAYCKAVELAPRAASTRYKKARALLAVGQIEEAQKELVILKDLAPDEGTVHFLLATLYRSMNEKQEAVRHFTIALALDPKAGPQIKEAIESFEDDIPMDDSLI